MFPVALKQALTLVLFVALCAQTCFSAQVTISSVIASGAAPFFGNLTYINNVSCTLSNGQNTTCLKVSSKAMANHVMGPYCDGGNWNNSVVMYKAYATDCNNQDNYSSCPTSDPKCLRCLECEPKTQNIVYYIPLVPTMKASIVAENLSGDNNWGDAVAINGVPLAKADPLAVLASQNNPAPIDWAGGHATLQYVYHYHAIPTLIPQALFGLQQGWNLTSHSWLSSAPNGQHSPLIGWSFDGLPIYGPYSTGGSKPTDLDAVYGHTHEPYGYHYHAKVIHDGKTHAFLGGYAAYSATQVFSSSTGGGAPGGGTGGGTPPGGGPPGGGPPGGGTNTNTGTTTGTSTGTNSGTTSNTTSTRGNGASAVSAALSFVVMIISIVTMFNI